MSDSRSAEFDFFEHMGFDSARLREGRAYYVPMFDGCDEVGIGTTWLLLEDDLPAGGETVTLGYRTDQ